MYQLLIPCSWKAQTYLLLTLSFLLPSAQNVSAQSVRPILSEYVQVTEVREFVRREKVKRKMAMPDATKQEQQEEYVERTYYRFYFRTDAGEILVFPDIGLPPLLHKTFEVGSCHIVRHYERDDGILSVRPIDCFAPDRS